MKTKKLSLEEYVRLVNWMKTLTQQDIDAGGWTCRQIGEKAQAALSLQVSPSACAVAMKAAKIRPSLVANARMSKAKVALQDRNDRLARMETLLAALAESVADLARKLDSDAILTARRIDQLAGPLAEIRKHMDEQTVALAGPLARIEQQVTLIHDGVSLMAGTRSS